MPQMHIYVSKAVADEVRRRAEIKGLTVSAFLAEVVRAEMDDSWPAGYLEEVIGSTASSPLVRPEQGDFEVRDIIK